ncbi:MAG: hypothetical protein ACXW4E_06640 [Anaerolineales bacterium]
MKNLTVNMISQWQYLWKVLVFLYLPIVLLFIAIGLLSNLSEEFTLSIFLLAGTTLADLPFYTGFVPQFVVILWSFALAICMFMFVALKRFRGDFARSRQFLLHAGMTTAVLLLDEAFFFHGEIAPKYLHIDKLVVIAAYLMLILFVAVSNRTEILSSEYLLPLLAVGLFGTSIVLDALPLRALNVQMSWQQLRFFLEDGSKLAGVVTWLAYLWRYAIRQIETISAHDNISRSS